MRKFRVAAVAIIASSSIVAGLTAASASVVLPRPATTTGIVHVIDYGDGQGVGSTVVLTGAIGDQGSADSIDADGTPDPVNNTEVQLSLVLGSFRISVVGFDKAIGKAFSAFKPNTSTCSGQVSATGTTPIVADSGTGAYAGISGSLTLTITFAEIGPKLKNGTCNESNSAPTIGSAQIVVGSGTVSY